jgi:hypothetical protein
MFLNDTESDRLQHIGHQADMLAASNLLADHAHAAFDRIERQEGER